MDDEMTLKHEAAHTRAGWGRCALCKCPRPASQLTSATGRPTCVEVDACSTLAHERHMLKVLEVVRRAADLQRAAGASPMEFTAQWVDEHYRALP